MFLSSIALRRIGMAAAASIALAAIALPSAAQMRQQMADKVAVNAAHQFVTKIQGESCSQFASTMSQMKGGSSSGSSSGGMSSKLKANSQARTDFVNIVAGPLLNKMIDCNMMPGGM
jgi:cell division protein FtsW (lipid II flippase)